MNPIFVNEVRLSGRVLIELPLIFNPFNSVSWLMEGRISPVRLLSLKFILFTHVYEHVIISLDG